MRPGRHEATAGDAMDDDSRRTVRFYVGGEHAIESEGMWADETPAGTYLVKNIPFFAYQDPYQDEEAARRWDDGRSEGRRVGEAGRITHGTVGRSGGEGLTEER